MSALLLTAAAVATSALAAPAAIRDAVPGGTPADRAAPAVSVGFGTGVDARLGKGAVFVGAGAGPTVTVRFSDRFDAHGEARWLTLAGNTLLLRGGVGARATYGAWEPGLGLDLTGYVGASLRAVTAENPTLAPDTALALQARVSPLRFTQGRFTGEALRVSLGAGWDRGEPALAFGLTLAEVGLAF